MLLYRHSLVQLFVFAVSFSLHVLLVLCRIPAVGFVKCGGV